MRLLLVGELNPYGSSPEYALYPLPEHASGARLCRILGMKPRAYMTAFDRVNLCSGSWSMGAARQAAEEIVAIGPRVVILLGRKVAEAFSLKDQPTLTRTGRFVLLPHPSGRCTAWNDPANVAKARQLLAEAKGGPT